MSMIRAAEKILGSKALRRLGLLLLVAGCHAAEIPPTPQDTSPSLPNALLFADGTRVSSTRQWVEQRRPELIALMAREMYGCTPGQPQKVEAELLDSTAGALGGIATREQVRLHLTGDEGTVAIELLIYRPTQTKGPVPAILAINFWGNHAVHADPSIRLSSQWIEEGKKNPFVNLSGVIDHRATEACRGTNASQWPLESIIARGYALVTFYREDVVHDQKWEGPLLQLPAAYPTLQNRGDNLSAIGAWAWSLGRVLDYLETNPAIDARRVALFGWSRLGKAALWAAARDTRFALLISHQSGAGGAALFKVKAGEDVAGLNRVFPYWYCQNFRKYNDKEELLPFDQHEVLALIAPRPLLVTSGTSDKAANERRQALSVEGAKPVYAFLGAPENLQYFVREGGHSVTTEDWNRILQFTDQHLQQPRQP